MFGSEGLKLIVGARIESAWRHEGDIYLVLEGEDRTFKLSPEGDCCANAYVQHVTIAYALRSATVMGVEDIESESHDGEGGDVVDVWGHRIVTDKGVCGLDCRTEHNGYYAGRLVVTESSGGPPPGAVPLEDF